MYRAGQDIEKRAEEVGTIDATSEYAIECAIAKVPIISTDVGIASQILHESSIYEIETFETAKPNISFAYNEALKYTTSSGMKEFNNMFKNLYES